MNLDAVTLILEADRATSRRDGRAFAVLAEKRLRADFGDVAEAVEAAELLRIALDATNDARRAEHEGNRGEADSRELDARYAAEELHALAQGFTCEACGEPGEPDRELRATVVSPPVSGYEFEAGLYHASCAAQIARQMVE
jgi:hypothetical protein